MTELAQHLPDGDARRDALTDALTATRGITDHYIRARALTSLAQHLPDGDARRDALTDALTATRGITHDYIRARALTSLAQHLPHDLLVGALTTARRITDVNDRAQR